MTEPGPDPDANRPPQDDRADLSRAFGNLPEVVEYARWLRAEYEAMGADRMVEALLEELELARTDLEAQTDELCALQRELEASRAETAAFFGDSPVACLVLSRRGLILEANRAAEKLFGLPLDTLVGCWLGALVASHDLPTIMAAMEAAHPRPPLPVTLRDGARQSCVDMHFSPHGSELRCVLIDRSPTLQARTSRARLEALYDAEPGAIVTTDGRWRIVDANRGAIGLFGASMEELLAESLQRFLHCPPLFLHGPPRTRRATRLESQVSAEARTMRGEAVPVEVTATGLLIEGRPTFIVTVRDVSDRKALQRELLDVTERVQRGIARDLHDTLGQHLVGISMLAHSLARRLHARQDGCASDLDRIHQLSSNLVTKSRLLIRGLYPVELEGKGLLHALQSLAAQTREVHGADVIFRQQGGDLDPLEAETSTQLYRIAQEAVNNAVRHARAASVLIRAGSSPEAAVDLAVIDDGRGLASPREGGMGLRIMRERARLVGASLQIGAGPRGGTMVRCLLSPRR
jgi:PAS domain S-box-containing protein